MSGARAPHSYSIHGIVRLRSERRLPELEYFRTHGDPGEVDIDVRVVPDPHRAAGPEALRYRELFGRWGFAMAVERAPDRTRVFVSPLIGLSPHVLYTNVVEPLIRWLVVRKGYALMHGACLASGDVATLVTARTDTGKTTTILKTLQGSRGRYAFLSDDMTLLDREGRVFSYPKPLTISRHTLHAIGGARLGIVERLKLGPQSRLHSKGGRGAGMRLYRMGLPAATLSAIVQRIIPPPKFMVDRLVDGARYAEGAYLRRVIVIERGADDVREVPSGQLVDLLISNAEDAYGFPPYPRIEDDLCRWAGRDLHGQERAIVAASVARVGATLVRSSTFGWHAYLLALAGVPSEPERRSAADAGGATGPRAVAATDGPEIGALDG